jgi:transposase
MVMAAAYSLDLRSRVLAEYDKGVFKKSEIAELFKIDQKTIYNWVKRRSLTGEIKPKSGYQQGHSHKITEQEKFKEFIANNPNINLKELAKRWGNVSHVTIGRMLHKLNYTFKKNSLFTKSGTKQSALNIVNKSVE